MVKRLKCFRRFRVRKGVRTFRKRFRSLPKYLWSFRVRKGAGNSEPPEPLCGSQLNTVIDAEGGQSLLLGTTEGYDPVHCGVGSTEHAGQFDRRW